MTKRMDHKAVNLADVPQAARGRVRLVAVCTIERTPVVAMPPDTVPDCPVCTGPRLRAKS